MRIKKVLFALLAFVAAAAAGYFIKESIDSRYPEYALPQITATADGEELVCVLDACSWTFLTGDTYNYGASQNIFELELAKNELMGGEALNISFSQQPEAVTVSRSERYSYEFRPCEGPLTVPYEEGGYLYEIWADYSRGYELFYLYIVVQGA